MYFIAGFFWWVYNFGPFWQFANSPKLKSPNLDTFYIDFTDKHVVFGDHFFFIYFLCKHDKKGQLLRAYSVTDTRNVYFTQNRCKTNVNK